MRKDVGSQIGDNPLAEPGHEIESRCAGNRQHEADNNHHAEIFVDKGVIVCREAEIDHAPDPQGHRQSCCCRNKQGDQGRDQHAAMFQDIWF